MQQTALPHFVQCRLHSDSVFAERLALVAELNSATRQMLWSMVYQSYEAPDSTATSGTQRIHRLLNLLIPETAPGRQDRATERYDLLAAIVYVQMYWDVNTASAPLSEPHMRLDSFDRKECAAYWQTYVDRTAPVFEIIHRIQICWTRVSTTTYPSRVIDLVSLANQQLSHPRSDALTELRQQAAHNLQNPVTLQDTSQLDYILSRVSKLPPVLINHVRPYAEHAQQTLKKLAKGHSRNKEVDFEFICASAADALVRSTVAAGSITSAIGKGATFKRRFQDSVRRMYDVVPQVLSAKNKETQPARPRGDVPISATLTGYVTPIILGDSLHTDERLCADHLISVEEIAQTAVDAGLRAEWANDISDDVVETSCERRILHPALYTFLCLQTIYIQQTALPLQANAGGEKRDRVFWDTMTGETISHGTMGFYQTHFFRTHCPVTIVLSYTHCDASRVQIARLHREYLDERVSVARNFSSSDSELPTRESANHGPLPASLQQAGRTCAPAHFNLAAFSLHLYNTIHDNIPRQRPSSLAMMQLSKAVPVVKKASSSQSASVHSTALPAVPLPRAPPGSAASSKKPTAAASATRRDAAEADLFAIDETSVQPRDEIRHVQADAPVVKPMRKAPPVQTAVVAPPAKSMASTKAISVVDNNDDEFVAVPSLSAPRKKRAANSAADAPQAKRSKTEESPALAREALHVLCDKLTATVSELCNAIRAICVQSEPGVDKDTVDLDAMERLEVEGGESLSDESEDSRELESGVPNGWAPYDDELLYHPLSHVMATIVKSKRDALPYEERSIPILGSSNPFTLDSFVFSPCTTSATLAVLHAICGTDARARPYESPASIRQADAYINYYRSGSQRFFQRPMEAKKPNDEAYRIWTSLVTILRLLYISETQFGAICKKTYHANLFVEVDSMDEVPLRLRSEQAASDAFSLMNDISIDNDMQLVRLLNAHETKMPSGSLVHQIDSDWGQLTPEMIDRIPEMTFRLLAFIFCLNDAGDVSAGDDAVVVAVQDADKNEDAMEVDQPKASRMKRKSSEAEPIPVVVYSQESEHDLDSIVPPVRSASVSVVKHSAAQRIEDDDIAGADFEDADVGAEIDSGSGLRDAYQTDGDAQEQEQSENRIDDDETDTGAGVMPLMRESERQLEDDGGSGDEQPCQEACDGLENAEHEYEYSEVGEAGVGADTDGADVLVTTDDVNGTGINEDGQMGDADNLEGEARDEDVPAAEGQEEEEQEQGGQMDDAEHFEGEARAADDLAVEGQEEEEEEGMDI